MVYDINATYTFCLVEYQVTSRTVMYDFYLHFLFINKLIPRQQNYTTSFYTTLRQAFYLNILSYGHSVPKAWNGLTSLLY